MFFTLTLGDSYFPFLAYSCFPITTVTLHPFICSIEAGEIVLNEHAAITWLAPQNLHSLDWAEADVPVIESYLVENRVDAS